MDLIRSSDTKYDEYETLLLERDQLLKDADSIWISYTQVFGQLITEVYEEKLECVKLKKTISYYQTALNRGGIVDPEAMQEYLEREMSSFHAELKRMMEDNERCKRAKQSSAYEVQRAKTLYRRLAKQLHPDINPETDRQQVLMELWQRIHAAYRQNDVKSLSELEVLAGKALEELGAGEIRVDIPDIEERIEELKKEILDIMNTEPYIYKALMEDEAAVTGKKSELTKELDDYKAYRKELEEAVQQILENGGIKLQWLMK